MATITIHRAALCTRNFTFEAFGATHVQAGAALLKGLLAHGKQYRLRAGWYEQDIPSIERTSFALGAAYRDREAVPGVVS